MATCGVPLSARRAGSVRHWLSCGLQTCRRSRWPALFGAVSLGTSLALDSPRIHPSWPLCGARQTRRGWAPDSGRLLLGMAFWSPVRSRRPGVSARVSPPFLQGRMKHSLVLGMPRAAASAGGETLCSPKHRAQLLSVRQVKRSQRVRGWRTRALLRAHERVLLIVAILWVWWLKTAVGVLDRAAPVWSNFARLNHGANGRRTRGTDS